MKRAAFAFAALIAMGGAAHAAEGKAPPPQCADFAAIKAELIKKKDLAGITFTPLTAGQFHFMMGIYAASAITPSGLPPGDGAQLVQTKKVSVIYWTRGKIACVSTIASKDESGQIHVDYMPFPVSPDLLKMLEAVKTGKDEVLSSDDTSEDLHL